MGSGYHITMLWSKLLLLASCAHAAVLGLDFGTEFVKLSLVAPNSPFEIVLTPDSQRKDASGLVIKPDTFERVYGSSGVISSARYSSSSIYRVKPLLGLDFDDEVVAEYQINNPGLELVSTSRHTVAINVSGTVFPVEEVAAMQIAEYASRATELLRQKTHSKTAVSKDVAISVPGSFGNLERQAMVSSAKLSGQSLITLVNDGVAVALNYANSPAGRTIGAEKKYIVVFDAGASGTSSTLLSLHVNQTEVPQSKRSTPDSENDEINDENSSESNENSELNDETDELDQKSNSLLADSDVVIKVEGFANTPLLGGTRLTSSLRDLILSKIEVSIKDLTPRAVNRLWRECEKAKHVLSANTEATVFLESLMPDTDVNVRITRSEFEEINSKAQLAAAETLIESLNGFDKHFSLTEVDAVVLAGGASRTPFVLQELTTLVGESKLSRNVNADEANVQGTTLRGVGVSGIFKAKRQFVVEDRIPRSYSVRIGSDVTPLFKAGAPLGSTQAVVTTNDVLQLLENNQVVGTYSLTNRKATLEQLDAAGQLTCTEKPNVLASFSIDMNGIVNLDTVTAVCRAVASDTESAESTSTEPAKPRGSQFKTRKVSFEEKNGALSPREQLEIRAHLRRLDEEDADRKQHAVLHHQLESLLYKLRSFDDEPLVSTANEMLEWVESGSGSVSELKSKLAQAHDLYTAATQPQNDELEDKISEVEEEPQTEGFQTEEPKQDHADL